MVAPTQIRIEDVESPRLRELLERVERGEVVDLVRDGQAVARVSPPLPDQARQGTENDMSDGEFYERLMQLRESIRKHNEGKPPITMEEIISWKHEGHRH